MVHLHDTSKKVISQDKILNHVLDLQEALPTCLKCTTLYLNYIEEVLDSLGVGAR